MKKILGFAAALLSICAIGASAAGFSATKQYTDGQFSDVSSDKWYAKDVKSAYELGFMKGTADTAFSPDGNVTLAEAVTTATRIHAIYNGKTAPDNAKEGAWYTTYVAYAEENGIIAKGEYADFTKPASRHEVAEIIAAALPADYYKAINNVTKIPDVPSTNAYADELLMLYNAGVIMGNDEYGTFKPESNIKRSEMSAIINRAALPESRLTKTLTNADYEDAYYLLDDSTGLTTGTVSVYNVAWNYDNRDRVMNVSNVPTSYDDRSDKLPVTVWRDIDDQDKGLVTFESNFSVTVAENAQSGFYYAITDDDKKELMRFELVNGEYQFNGKPTGFKYAVGQYGLRVDMDLDTNKATLYIEGKAYGEYDLPEVKAGRVYIGTTEAAKNVRYSVSKVVVYRNYLVNEKFDVSVSSEQNIPADWKTTGFAIAKHGDNSYNDCHSMYSVLSKAGTSTAVKTFNKISGNVVFESYILLPKADGKATVTLKGGDKAIASIIVEGDKITTADGKELRYHRANMWQTLRIEADTTTGNITYKVNGKTCGTFYTAGIPTFADSIEITHSSNAASKMYFDDVEVYLTHEYDDYCPTPVPALSDKYDVVLNICSLWHQGQHRGWEAVSAFADKEPVLGYYDEGLTELADWEIKYMVEHGIEVQHLCWYCPSNDINVPIKKSRMNDALHDGFFNAKYSDMMKFTFMWENSGQNVKNLEQFEKYIWNYWVDYYFTDDRFYVVDNKPVFTVWSYTAFKNAFGGVEGSKKARAFMEEDIKKYGFDGVIMLFADSHRQDAAGLAEMASLGCDGVYAYHWQQDGIYADSAMKRMQKNASYNKTHIVPTASVGFNNIGWVEDRKPMASLEEHAKQLEYIRDKYLPNEKQGTWESKMVIISTWNEYGEGTYVMPAGVNGFGYLDNVRNVLVGDGADMTAYNVIPTEQQKDRLGHMYTGDMTSLMHCDNVETKNYTIPEEVVLKTDLTLWEKGFGISGYEESAEVIKITPNANDHGIIYEGPLSEINPEEIDAVHIKLKTDVVALPEMFFITSADKEWNGKKGFKSTTTVAGQVCDIYFDTRTNSSWSGTLEGLRFDPINTNGKSEIYTIEFLKFSDNQTPTTLNIDGYTYDPSDKIVYENGEYYIPAEPMKGFFSIHNFYYEWSRYTGRLYILTKDNMSLEFTVGSDKVLVNGKEQKLAKPLELCDGLPMMPYTWLMKTIGNNSFKADGKNLSISLVDPKYYDALKSRVANEWEFNIPGDIEGWTPGSMSYEVTEDGTLLGTAIKREENPPYDPVMGRTDLALDANKYYKVKIRAKFDIENDTHMGMYFATSDNQGLSEAKHVGFTVKKDEAGEFKEYEIDFSVNENWVGTVTQVRLDPISGAGSFEIDYIRFVYDAKGMNAATYNAEAFEILNGDASDVKSKAFSSKNAQVKIIDDPDKDGNKIFDVTSTGKQWAYFRQKVTYTPGATYKVSFDVKLSGTNDGSKDSTIGTQIHVNAVYADPAGSSDHVVAGKKVSVSDGWVHYECEYTVSTASANRANDEFTIYANPVGELGCDYQIDNVVVTEVKP